VLGLRFVYILLSRLFDELLSLCTGAKIKGTGIEIQLIVSCLV
jgi:hypothetical protein